MSETPDTPVHGEEQPEGRRPLFPVATPEEADELARIARADAAGNVEGDDDDAEDDDGTDGEAAEAAEAAPEGDEGPSREAAGAEVIRLGSAATPTDWPALVRDEYGSRGAVETGETYSGHLRRFLAWCATRGVDTKTMPPDTSEKYLAEAYANPLTRANACSALRAGFDIGKLHGIEFAAQDLKPIPRPARSRRREENGVNGTANGVAHAQAQAAAEEMAGANTVAQPAPAQRVAQPRGSTMAGPKKPGQVLPSLGQRIRISKRATGSEGLGVPVGTLILVGDYTAGDVEGEGRLDTFIANQIRPVYGPFRGDRPTVYFVDRLDNVGNPVPGSTLQVPVMPSDAPPPAAGYAQAQVQPAAQPAVPSPTGDALGMKFIEYLMAQQQRAEAKAEEVLKQVQQGMASKGMDPTVLMLLMQQMKPEPLDIAKAASEFRRMNPPPAKPPRDEMEDLFRNGGPPGRGMPGPYGGLGGLDLEPLPQPKDATLEVIGQMMRQQGELLTTLLTRRETPPPAQPAQRDPLDLALTLVKMMNESRAAATPVQAPSDPLRDKLLDIALAQMTKPPEKEKGLLEQLHLLQALKEGAGELLGGEKEPMSITELIAEAVANAPKIGEAAAAVLSAIPRAPQLPPRAAPQALPPAPVPNVVQRNPQPNASPIPEPAKQAILRLVEATDDQEIANLLFVILTEYSKVTPQQDPTGTWNLVAKRLIDDFKKADTKLEIRTVATQLFVFSGAKKIMERHPACVERITSTLHTYYPLIYTQLTGGQEKHLKDAVPMPVEAPKPVETTPSVVNPHSTAPHGLRMHSAPDEGPIIGYPPAEEDPVVQSTT